MFLVLDREDESFRGKSHFPLVNRVFFETKKERFEIDDFEILSLARPRRGRGRVEYPWTVCPPIL